MAKFVIAGKSNCPYYAKAELLADQLARNLPDFRVYKIVKDPNEWDNWLKEVCSKNNWKHAKSPLIWRELVDRGGKGMYMGDANDFQEYANNYYGIKSQLLSDDLRKISAENEKTFKIVEDERLKNLSKIQPLLLTISNPDVNVLYYIMNEILNGSVFGAEEISLRLYTTSSDNNIEKSIEGIKMEIEDLASTKLRDIKIVKTPEKAFTNCDFVIIFDELTSELNDNEYHNPYIQLAKDINKYAKSTCKILITPFQSRAQIYALCTLCSQHLKRINSKIHLIGNSMCDVMFAKAVLANRLRINQAYLKNVNIIGQSLNDSFFIDLSYGKITNYDGAVWARSGTHWLSLLNMIADKEWVRKDFVNSIRERDNTIREKLNRNTILIFSQSIVSLIRSWCSKDSQDDGIYSAIVNANGNYGIKEDIYLSVPLKFDDGEFFFIKNYKFAPQVTLIISDIIQDSKRRIAASFKDEIYIKDAYQQKLSITNVLFE